MLLRKTYWRWVFAAGFVLVLAMWNPIREHELPPHTPWDLLMQSVDASGTLLPSDSLNSLDGQAIMLTGFMYPLENGRDHHHFLLSPYSASCPFHSHKNSAYTVEVFTNEAVRFTYNPVAVKGVFTLEVSDGNIRYRINKAIIKDLS